MQSAPSAKDVLDQESLVPFLAILVVDQNWGDISELGICAGHRGSLMQNGATRYKACWQS